MRYFLFVVLPVITGLAIAADKADQPKAKKVKTPASTGKAPDKKTAPAEPRAPTGKSSSLQVGADVPGPFNPYNVTGPAKGKYHCLLSEHGLNPMVLIFVRTLDLGGPFKDFLQKLDTLIDKNPGVHLSAMIVYIPDELKDVLENDDQRDQLALKLEDLFRPALKHVVLALDTKADAEKYLVNEDAVMTVVLHRKYRIDAVHFLPRDQVTEAKASQILGEIAEKVGAKKK